MFLFLFLFFMGSFFFTNGWDLRRVCIVEWKECDFFFCNGDVEVWADET